VDYSEFADAVKQFYYKIQEFMLQPADEVVAGAIFLLWPLLPAGQKQKIGSVRQAQEGQI